MSVLVTTHVQQVKDGRRQAQSYRVELDSLTAAMELQIMQAQAHKATADSLGLLAVALEARLAQQVYERKRERLIYEKKLVGIRHLDADSTFMLFTARTRGN